MILTMTLAGPPFAWMRARDVGGTYVNPREYQAWLRQASTVIGFAWREPKVVGRLHAAKRPPLDEPLCLDLAFLLARPQRRPDVIPRELWDADRCPAVSRQDIDNFVAAVMDAMTQAKIWVDDTRVVRLTAAKTYLPTADTAERTEITLCGYNHDDV